MDFEKAIVVLAEAGVEFVVIGGVAMLSHGSPHITYDLDVCYSRSPENVRRLADALAPYHPRLRGAPEGLPFRLDEQTIRHGLNFTLVTDLGEIDLLGEVAGLGSYPAVQASSQTVESLGKKWQLLSLDGLIRSKRAAGRKRDLEAIRELEALLELKHGPKRKKGVPGKS